MDNDNLHQSPTESLHVHMKCTLPSISVDYERMSEISESEAFITDIIHHHDNFMTTVSLIDCEQEINLVSPSFTPSPNSLYSSHDCIPFTPFPHRCSILPCVN